MPPPSEPDLVRIEEIADEFIRLGVSQEAVEPIRDWVRDRRAGKPQIVVYFGCWGDVGHYLWFPNHRHPERDDPRFERNAAGPFPRLDGRLTPRDDTRQSAAAIHHRDGWTALAMHDYTVDKRGGSNSVFVMDSDVSYEGALVYIAEAFPTVYGRICEGAPIRCVQIEGARDQE